MIYYSWSNSSAWSGSGEESSSPKRSELCALFYCSWWVKSKGRRRILEQWMQFFPLGKKL